MRNKSNTGEENSGYWNSGNKNSGNKNSGNWNSGNRNSGDRNSGNWNSGNGNSGNWNSGNWNWGNRNSGNWNSGNRNSGNWNSGNWNSGNRNSGHFNTDKPRFIRVFNQDVDIEDFTKWEKPKWLYFKLTEWVPEGEMTDKEKEANPGYKSSGGYLKTKDYKEAFQESYNKASREDQLRIKECPNFDADLFFEISGIRVEDEPEEMTLEEICAELGRNVKVIK